MAESSTEAVICGFTHWRGTPAFALPSLGQFLKRVLGAVFVAQKGIWLFPAYHPFVEDVVHDLKIVVPNIQFDDKAQEHIKAVEELGKRLKTFDIPLRDDFSFATQPYQHQEEAVRFMLAMLRCGIFYDMGLGKTKAVIDVIRHDKIQTLVLSPLVGVHAWTAEVQAHTEAEELKLVALIGTPKKRAKLLHEEVADADIVVTTYDTAKREFDNLVACFPYHMIVADESHYLRGHKSARTKCAIALASRAYRRILLSGTPSLGNPLHLYGQLSFLGSHIPATDFWTFRKRYTITHSREFGGKSRKLIVGFKNLDMLNEKVQRIAIRRKKEECLDLPERQIIDVPFEIKGEQKTLYNDLVVGSVAELDSGELVEAANAGVMIQKLLQVLSGFFIMPPPEVCDGCKHLKVCVDKNIKPFTKRCSRHPNPYERKIQRLKANPKVEALDELLEGILAEERNKVIVWAYFREELRITEELLKAKGVKYLRLDGSNSTKGPAFSKKFQEDPEIRVWLAQISTGVALTLTAATYMIYFDLSYDLGAYLQSMDRNYRIGQDNAVTVYRLTCKGSVLEYVAEALAQKQNIADTLADTINCVFCKQGLECITKVIKPFEKGCVHKSRTARVITRPMKL